MKQGIHPEYKTVVVRCACGRTVKTRSTAKNISVEVCSNCHPHYTGQSKIMDTAGRVDRFNKRYEKKER